MSNHSARRGFTLLELLVAGLITAFVTSAVGLSLRQLVGTKGATKERLEAHLRADAALSAMRRDLASALRREDLFYTRLLITDGAAPSPLGYLERDEILVFNNCLRPTRHVDFIGEGTEFETQYRIEEDDLGPVLWRRRDPMPDEYLYAGGIAAPLVEGIVEVSVEAYDGDRWYPDWDSDFDGLPLALRVTVMASGHRPGADVFDSPLAALRTVIPIDRVAPPPQEPEEDEATAEDEALDEAAGLLEEAGGVPGEMGTDGEGGGTVKDGSGGGGMRGGSRGGSRGGDVEGGGTDGGGRGGPPATGVTRGRRGGGSGN